MKEPKKIATHYLTFPSVILSDERLSPVDLLLLGLIIFYDKEKGCFAQNKRLAAFVHCSVGSVSKSIKKLQVIGYIKSSTLDKEHGGRGRIRRVRDDLKSDMADTLSKSSSHEKKSIMPSKKDTHIYKGIKRENKEKKYSNENEKKRVEEFLHISLPNKWGIYKSCQKEYTQNHFISWNERDVNSLISLLNKLSDTFLEKLKSLPITDHPDILLQIFEIIIKSKPKFFYNSLPSTYDRFWNIVIQEEKVKGSILRIFMRYGIHSDRGFF